MSVDPYSAVFEDADGLRDIYVRGTTERDWRRFQAFLAETGYPLKFLRDDEEAELPGDLSELVVDPDVGNLLEVDLGGVVLYCHFFAVEEIELDLLPTEVDSDAAVRSVLEFMMRLGNALEKPVVLTPENRPDAPLLRFVPGAPAVERVSNGA